MRFFRRAGPERATAAQWHPSGEPCQMWDASVVADDHYCASSQVFAVRWVRDSAPGAAIVCCFYPAFGNPAGEHRFVIGCTWQQQSRIEGGGTWVRAGWGTVGDGWSLGCSTLDHALTRARCVAYYSTAGQGPHIDPDPFGWDGIPSKPSRGRPLPDTWRRP